MKIMSNDPDMLEEYDFSKGVRGKYAKKYKKGITSISLLIDNVIFLILSLSSIRAWERKNLANATFYKILHK